MTEILRGIATTASGVGEVVGAIGGTLRAPDMDSGKICTHFGWCHRIKGAEVL